MNFFFFKAARSLCIYPQILVHPTNVKYIKVFDTIHHKYNSIITSTSETYLIQMSEL